MGKYDDIINMKYKGVPNHKHMSGHDRASQFSPFAALVGYDKIIEGRAIVYDERREPTEDELAALNNVLNRVKRNDTIEVYCYMDGYYRTVIGRFVSYDQVCQHITVDKKDISLADVLGMNIISDNP